MTLACLIGPPELVILGPSGTTTVTIRTNAGSEEVRDMIAQSGMEGGVREQFQIIEERAAALA